MKINSKYSPKLFKTLPQWAVQVIDAFILFQTIITGYFIRSNFDLAFHREAFFGAFSFVSIGVVALYFTKSHKGILRHLGMSDGILVVRSVFITFASLLTLNFLLGYFFEIPPIIPGSVLVFSSLLAMAELLLYRFMIKEAFVNVKQGYSKSFLKRAVIFGAGEAGLIAYSVFNKDPRSRLDIIGFMDDDPKKVGRRLKGLPVFKGVDDIQNLAESQGVNELIIAIKNISVQRKKEIIDECLKYKVHTRIIPPVDQWVHNRLEADAIQELKIEDLLSREEIVLDNPRISKEIHGKKILVTGAAGSIGSELCRQLAFYKPAEIILLDIAESALYELEQDLMMRKVPTRVISIVADIRNKRQLAKIFSVHVPDFVFHAAAYKHVPLMEKYPEEAIKSNILGTKYLADLAVLHKVKKFVFISTDKAVNPTNVMGATKRVAEIYVQAYNQFLELNHKTDFTKFITTRFGNVLGSNGSVVPLFKKQILYGGPLTVTDPEITRYFMTIPEASQLVLEAGVMGKGGELFAFDMGQPVKILDLAKRMIHLSGKKLNEDIEIIFTGLREGEKLHEEILLGSEKVKITYHPKIWIVPTESQSYYKIEAQIEYFEELVRKYSEIEMVHHLKVIVPEFVSKSSRFDILDRLN